MKPFLVAFVLLTSTVLAGAATAQQAPDYATKAWSGDIVVGLPINNISPFFSPFILSSGETYFTANLAGGEQAFMSSQQIAVITGAQVGGAAAGTVVDFLGQAVINDQAEIVMSAVFSGPAVDTSNDSGVIVYNGSLNIELQKGTSVPDVDVSDVVDFFGSLRNSDSGDHTYSGFLTPSGEQALFITPAGGTPAVVQVTGQVLGNERLATVSTASIGVSRRMALYLRKWVNVDNPIQRTRDELVARIIPTTTGDIVPLQTGDSGFGLPAGSTVDELYVPKANDNDQVALFVDYIGAEAGRSVHVYDFDENGNLTGGRSAVKIGDAAPGLTAETFASFQNYVLNESGNVAVLADTLPTPPASLTGEGPAAGVAPNTGIWFEDSSATLQLAAHQGMQAPGLDAGVSIVGLGFPAFNDRHQVAFKSQLIGPGVDAFVNDEALWATDPDGFLHLVARTGDLFDVDDDPETEDLRTINDIGVIANSGGTGGESTSFNDAGQLAFTLSFTDSSSGVFVASWATINSPLLGDFNGDGRVDLADYTVWRDNLGAPDTAIGNAGDMLGVVDSGDYQVWRTHFGNPAATLATRVPEPSCLALLALGSLATLLPRPPTRR